MDAIPFPGSPDSENERIPDVKPRYELTIPFEHFLISWDNGGVTTGLAPKVPKGQFYRSLHYKIEALDGYSALAKYHGP